MIPVTCVKLHSLGTELHILCRTAHKEKPWQNRVITSLKVGKNPEIDEL